MKHPIQGLHHVTATVGEARADLGFYRELLGLRLVKKTVNFANHNVYHFYYGDERGSPGTLWPGESRVRQLKRRGSGSIARRSSVKSPSVWPIVRWP